MNEKQISLLAGFAAAGVEYAVVGGVAVNALADVEELEMIPERPGA